MQSGRKLDAVIDLRNCVSSTLKDRYGEFTLTLIGVDDTDPDSEGGGELGEGEMKFDYCLKARDNKEATQWVNAVKQRMQVRVTRDAVILHFTSFLSLKLCYSTTTG